MRYRNVILAIACVSGCTMVRPDKDPVAMPSAVGWCALQKDYFSELKLQCNSITGAVEVPSFVIPGENNRLLTECIPGAKIEEFGYRTYHEGVAVPEYEEDWSAKVSLSAGLRLKEVSVWLPDIKVGIDNDPSLRVRIKVEEPEFRKISDPSMVFLNYSKNRQLLPSVKTMIDSCLRILCNGNSVIYTEALLGYPAITFTSKRKLAIEEKAGWKVLGVEGEQGANQTQTVKMIRDRQSGKVLLGFKQMSSLPQFSRDGLCAGPPS